MIPINETYREFCVRHGDLPGERKYVSIVVNGQRIFPDGANALEGGMGAYNISEPSENNYDRLMLQQIYTEAKLVQETKDFNSFKNDCLESSNSPYGVQLQSPGPPPNAAEQLEHGKLRIEKLRAKLAEIEVEILRTPEGEELHRQEAQKFRRQNDERLAAQSQRDVLSSINI